MEKCGCFYAEQDPTADDGICNCGHALDEHDEDGDCPIMVEL